MDTALRIDVLVVLVVLEGRRPMHDDELLTRLQEKQLHPE